MYKVESTSTLVRATKAAGDARMRHRVGRTVLLLGTCSLLTDISSEMVTAVLPVYIVATLGFTPLQFGVLDGIYQGASALIRLVGGFMGDRMRRHKPVASIGYGISAFAKLMLALIGSSFGAISAVILADRAGKGLRTAPRDAMISRSVGSGDLGLAFGVHRAMDTAGAMLGPLVAFLLLAVAPGAFSTLFLVAFLVAVVGLGVITLLVREPKAAAPSEPPPQLRAALHLLREPRFRMLAIASCALGLATASDGFVYLLLMEHYDFDLAFFPLLATGTASSYMLLATPVGRFADRHGRVLVMLGGYGCLVAVYVALLIPGLGAAGLVVVLGLLGAYYAATDGVLMAIGSAEVPDALRGSGLALLGTGGSLARLVASIAFGALWTATSASVALIVFGVALVVAIAMVSGGLRAVRVH